MGVNGSDDFDVQPTVSKAYVIIHLSDITNLIIFISCTGSISEN
jgi:hypothetical protein